MYLQPAPAKNDMVALRARLRLETARILAPHHTVALPLGIEEVDRQFPGRGLPPGLQEIVPIDYRGGPAAWGFLLALAGTLSKKRGGPFVWALSQKDLYDFGGPYGSGLRHFGFDPGRCLFVRCTKGRDALWAMEEALRIGGVAAVIGQRPNAMDLTMSRRLQLAAEETGTPVFLFRPHDDDGLSAARTRWRIAPAPSARDRFGLAERARWLVTLDRAGSGATGTWMMEWDHDAVCLRLPSRLADRTVLSGEAKKIA